MSRKKVKQKTEREEKDINESLSAEISTLEKEDKVLNFKIKQMSFWQLFKYWIKGCKDI